MAVRVSSGIPYLPPKVEEVRKMFGMGWETERNEPRRKVGKGKGRSDFCLRKMTA